MKAGALALLLLLASPVGAYNDPIATMLTPDTVWVSETAHTGILHLLVTVPGPGEFDLDVLLPPDLRCPPKEVIKRKLPSESPMTVMARVFSMGWHPEDGFNKLRILSWGAEPTVYHVVVYYCRP